MGFTIEMTLRGVLLAGKWRTEEELNRMTTEDKRNTLIVVMTNTSNQSVSHFQGLNDNDLIGVGAVVVFLQAAGIRSGDVLKTYSDDDKRNTLIVANNTHTDIAIGTLQGYDNIKLVQIGLDWYAKSKTVAAVLELQWVLDFAKVLETVPDVIATQHFDNRNSFEPLVSTFTFEKEVENKSTFSHEHGFDVHVGVETKFTGGIPGLASNETTVKIDVSTNHKWSFGEENVTRQKYSHSTQVSVPPGKLIQRVAQVTSGNLSVPYRAKIRTADGLVTWIQGTWHGVSTTNLMDVQTEIEH